MAIAGNINLYEMGFRWYHDPNMHYEITPDSQVRINPQNGQAIMYFGMRDYLVEGVRTRKELRVVQGAPIFFLHPIDGNGDRNWDGVKGLKVDFPNTLNKSSWSGDFTASERVCEYSDPDSAVTNDGTIARVACAFVTDNNARYVITNSTNGNSREIGASNTTSVTMNKNEYISGFNTHGDRSISNLKSGIKNVIKVTVTFDLAYDFTGQSRGLEFFTMPDTAVQVLEYSVDV